MRNCAAQCQCQKARGEERAELSRAHAQRAFQQRCLFFAVTSVTLVSKMRAIKPRKREKQRGNKPFFLCCFIVIRHYIFRDLLKYILNMYLISCLSVVYSGCCDTCDSKKIKTLGSARIRVRARGCDYRYFYNCKVSISSERFPIDLLQFQHLHPKRPVI